MTVFKKDPLPLIDSFYEAALKPTSWFHALSGIKEYTPCEGIAFSCCDLSDANKGSPTILVDLDPHGWEAYCQDYAGTCPRIRFACENRPNFVFYDYAHTSEKVMRSSDYYDLVEREWGTKYYMGMMFDISENIEGHLGVHRTSSVGHPQEEDLKLMEYIRPHIHRALQLTHKVAFSDLLNDLRNRNAADTSQGVLVLNKRGAIVYANSLAADILNQKDGLYCHENRLRAKCSYDDSKLINALSASISNPVQFSGQAMQIARDNEKLPYHLMISRVPNFAAFGIFGAAAAIFITDPAKMSSLEPPKLEQLFGLTPKEAELLYNLTKFASLSAAANEMIISKHTARVHLKNIFYKTRTNSQAELIKLAMSA